MRGVIRDLRASIKNPQDYTARTDPNVPIEEVAGVMAIQNRYSMMARWHEVLFPVLEEFTAEAMDQNQKLLELLQDMAREKKRHASAAFFGVDALQKALDRTDFRHKKVGAAERKCGCSRCGTDAVRSLCAG